MLHGYSNKRMDNGSMEKRNPQGTDITEKRSRKSNENVSATVSFDEVSVIIGEERYTDWKVGWKELKKILSEGQKRNKQQSLAEKELQSEIPKQYGKGDFGWLKCNTAPPPPPPPRKTSSMFALQEQMIETSAWKKFWELVHGR